MQSETLSENKKSNNEFRVCDIEVCDFEALDSEARCILHCDKTGFLDRPNVKELQDKFFENLILYIHNEIKKTVRRDTNPISRNRSYSLEEVKAYLLFPVKSSQEMRDFIESISFDLVGINFPEISEETDIGLEYLRIGYVRLLNSLSEISFSACKFHTKSLHLPSSSVNFHICTFYKPWKVSGYRKSNLNINPMYGYCTFLDDVSIENPLVSSIAEDEGVFKDCVFKRELRMSDANIGGEIFRNSEGFRQQIKNVRISKCSIAGKFRLNNLCSEEFEIKDSVFSGKFEFKENVINVFKVENTNHKGLLDAYKTSFGKFSIKKSIYEEFVGFENCHFGLLKEGKETPAEFIYATFLDFVNFRNVKFHVGLDLEHINLKEAPNFLRATVSPERTNRETYRIIKDSFDSVGNHIEANKYFVQEMKKYKEELKKDGISQARLIFFLNEKLSNFGQDFVLPILWLVFFSLLYFDVGMAVKLGFLYDGFPFGNNGIMTYLNQIALNVLPFSKFLIEGREFSSLLMYIVYAVLIWQTVVAVKRHTRR